MQRIIFKLLCSLGRHAWEPQRFWAIEDYLADGFVCRRCKATDRKRRTVVWREEGEAW